MNRPSGKILVALTGASGMLYLRGFLEVCAGVPDLELHGISSAAGVKVLRLEEGVAPAQLTGISRWFAADDFTAPPASGSSDYRAMVILPCSMGTLAAIASGLSANLIHRSADVMLKERRTVVLAVRETPLNRTHLLNMLAAHDAGAVICPPMPGFYLKPADLAESARYYAWRVLDQLGIDVPDRKRWGG
ncbi:UbiX family flavin prenyltransferase [Desulfofustis limnaeus]|jgi:4-hydroxy-3-polyprenylbenzoate decarboxylase|uniref:Flavin prenyltransferase UbiX n=1 Tax=Desulfofustis limnaeus TaxID=2740163 RepID=A0ABN6M2C8_9BACT|nr:UbiX family flavin prenyltransferase [Desulfofustis limnaeus]MDX9896444.1 UbiX family flavin prenyltransferase [Desulfofustis sp.]BDD87038.1 flavin prenyltransferase UbiX [Desulfofustis limnaeus]